MYVLGVSFFRASPTVFSAKTFKPCLNVTPNHETINDNWQHRSNASTSYWIRKLATTTFPKKISTILLSTPWELPNNHWSSCFNLGSEKGHFEAVMVYWVRLHNATTVTSENTNLNLNPKTPTFLTDSTNQSKLQTKTELHTHTHGTSWKSKERPCKEKLGAFTKPTFFCKVW